MNFVNLELYLLKYLDKQDIEECGFIEGLPNIFNIKNKKGEPIRLQYFKESNLLVIFYPEYLYNGEILFQGIIKNKSELKRLLKQLNIN